MALQMSRTMLRMPFLMTYCASSSSSLSLAFLFFSTAFWYFLCRKRRLFGRMLLVVFLSCFSLISFLVWRPPSTYSICTYVSIHCLFTYFRTRGTLSFPSPPHAHTYHVMHNNKNVVPYVWNVPITTVFMLQLCLPTFM